MSQLSVCAASHVKSLFYTTKNNGHAEFLLPAASDLWNKEWSKSKWNVQAPSSGLTG